MSHEELGDLQLLVLRAILGQDPLPGADGPLSFPDLPTLMASGAVPILADDLWIDESRMTGLPIRVVETVAVGDHPGLGGYLRFRPPESDGDAVQIVLDSLVPPRAGQHEMGLGGVQVTFARDGGGWKVVGGPTVSAM